MISYLIMSVPDFRSATWWDHHHFSRWYQDVSRIPMGIHGTIGNNQNMTINQCNIESNWDLIKTRDVSLSSWQVHLPTFDKHVSAGCGQFPTCNGRIWSEICAKPTQIGIQMEKVGEMMGNIWKNVDQQFGDVIFSVFSTHDTNNGWHTRVPFQIAWVAAVQNGPQQMSSEQLCKNRGTLANRNIMRWIQGHTMTFQKWVEKCGKNILQNRDYTGIWHWARRIHNFQLWQEPHLHRENTEHCRTQNMWNAFHLFRNVGLEMFGVWQTILSHTRASNSPRSYCHVLGQCVP